MKWRTSCSESLTWEFVPVSGRARGYSGPSTPGSATSVSVWTVSPWLVHSFLPSIPLLFTQPRIHKFTENEFIHSVTTYWAPATYRACCSCQGHGESFLSILSHHLSFLGCCDWDWKCDSIAAPLTLFLFWQCELLAAGEMIQWTYHNTIYNRVLFFFRSNDSRGS